MDALIIIWNALQSAINSIFQFLMSCADAFFFWLPADPFTNAINDFTFFCANNSQALGWLNWFFPVPLLVSVLALLVSCMAAWVGYLITIHVFDWLRGVKQTVNPGG